MADWDIKLKPESQRVLNRLAKAGKIDLRPSLLAVGISYQKEVEQAFAHQQPRGEAFRWPPLSPRYAAWKAKHFPGAPILVRTGKLRRSMTQKGAPGNIFAVGKNRAIFGSSIYYGIYHDALEPKNRTNPPRRNFSEPSEQRRKIWINDIRRDIIHNFEINGIEVKSEIFKE